MLSQLQSYSEQCFLSNTESTHQDHTHGQSVTLLTWHHHHILSGGGGKFSSHFESSPLVGGGESVVDLLVK